jgi:hypothetical protein
VRTDDAYAASSDAASGASAIRRICGRSAIGTGSSSPARVTSYTAFTRAAFPPTRAYTVCSDTPAAPATARMVVPPYPSSSSSVVAASRMRRRVSLAEPARSGLSYRRVRGTRSSPFT